MHHNTQSTRYNTVPQTVALNAIHFWRAQAVRTVVKSDSHSLDMSQVADLHRSPLR